MKKYALGQFRAITTHRIEEPFGAAMLVINPYKPVIIRYLMTEHDTIYFVQVTDEVLIPVSERDFTEVLRIPEPGSEASS
ncbi:MAG: hypothetical protein CUN54_08335 [Phototrophicales bacterium]|nr:MAG: hypothetical protein CUN54_08335 [Phototrophicales bacterium]